MKVLKIAVQKSGRLNQESLKILKDCGISIDNGRDQLKAPAKNFPLEIYYLRNGDIPQYLKDGLLRNNVEFWSGGLQVCRGLYTGCNIKRVIYMHPDHFSKYFLYHASNYKQRASL